jgi:hypothetical protein
MITSSTYRRKERGRERTKERERKGDKERERVRGIKEARLACENGSEGVCTVKLDG